MKIDKVSSGEYSGCGIDAAFTDRKRTELNCAVHEWCLDEYINPDNKSYDERLVEMKKVARDYIAKYKAEKGDVE